MACPVCDKPTNAAYKPFCSKHCADVDLGRWLSGSYVLPGTEQDDIDLDEMDDVPTTDLPDRPH